MNKSEAGLVLVFDLDDTLYGERSFESSGISHCIDHFLPELPQTVREQILLSRTNWVQSLLLFGKQQHHELTAQEILAKYRSHSPKISLYRDADRFLKRFLGQYHMALITDGRSQTQRLKLNALGISDFFNPVIISEEIGSEKPSTANFNYVNDKYPRVPKLFFGDNLRKDFVTPKKMGWKTYCLLDRGNNVHSQDIEVEEMYKPDHYINSFDDLNL